MVDLGWLQMFLREWFWMIVDGFGPLQMALGGFRWFWVIFNFSSYVEIRCLKFKRSTQLWGVFIVSSNNDARVPLKQMTKFLGSSAYNVSLKKTLGWWEKFFVLWKLTYIALCKFSPHWLRFFPFWGNFFKDLLVWLIIVWQVSILGWVSEKYSYFLKTCCSYIFQISILLYQRRKWKEIIIFGHL